MGNYSLFLSSLGRMRRNTDSIDELITDVSSISSAVITLSLNEEAIRSASGLTLDFGYPIFSGTNFLDSTSSITGALLSLDTNSLLLGEMATTAYRGDRGKISYDHSQITLGNPHGTTKTDIGLGNVENTADVDKPVSTATQTALNGKSDIWHNHDTVYLGITAKAADSDKLDGIDSTGFALASHNHNTAYLGIGAKAVDSDKLDGYDSADFARFIQLSQAIGNISNPLLHLPLKKNLLTAQGQSVCTFTRASAATYIDRYGVLKSVAANIPRFTADGLLIEGASTNLLTYSEQFENGAWVKTRASVSANTTSTLDPFGTNLADKFVEDTSVSNSHYISQNIGVTSGTSYTLSIFVKAAERTQVCLGNISANKFAYFDLAAGNVISSTSGVSAEIKQLANGWFRCTMNYTSSATATQSHGFLACVNGSFGYTGDGTSGLYIFGAQLEAMPFASSYIPTTSTSATMTANNFSIKQAENLPAHSGSFSYALDFVYNGQSTANLDFLFADGTTDFRAFIQSNTLLVNINNIQLTAGISPNTKYRMILVGGSTTLYLYLNGIMAASGAMGGKVSNKTNLYIGSYNGTANHLFGTISNLRTYDRALTAEEVRLA